VETTSAGADERGIRKDRDVHFGPYAFGGRLHAPAGDGRVVDAERRRLIRTPHTPGHVRGRRARARAYGCRDGGAARGGSTA